MSGQGQETEAKFYVQDLERIRSSLENVQAVMVQGRVLEKNFRFDRPDGSLRARGQVLRLRYDTEARLTYKGSNKGTNGVLSREEIEFVAGNFQKAKEFLEALGYQQVFYYEKYRTTYQLDQTLMMLDELPYGNFLEIEGESETSIQTLARQLNLNWGAAIERSYSALFEDIQKKFKLSFRDLSFENFGSLTIEAEDLGVSRADQ